VRERLKVRAERAGLDARLVHPHRFRHTHAHDFLLAGGQERDLMRLMGWRSEGMLSRYGASAADHRAMQAARRLRRGDRIGHGSTTSCRYRWCGCDVAAVSGPLPSGTGTYWMRANGRSAFEVAATATCRRSCLLERTSSSWLKQHGAKYEPIGELRSLSSVRTQPLPRWRGLTARLRVAWHRTSSYRPAPKDRAARRSNRVRAARDPKRVAAACPLIV
jgi:hypothetical protein